VVACGVDVVDVVGAVVVAVAGAFVVAVVVVVAGAEVAGVFVTVVGAIVDGVEGLAGFVVVCDGGGVPVEDDEPLLGVLLPDVELDGVPPVDVDPPVDGDGSVVPPDAPADESGLEVVPDEESVPDVPSTGSVTIVVPDEGAASVAGPGEEFVPDVVPDDGLVFVVVPDEGSVLEVVPGDESVVGVVPEEGAEPGVVPDVVSLLVVLAVVVPEVGGVPEPDPAEEMTTVSSAPPTIDHSERLATEQPCRSVQMSLRTSVLEMPGTIRRNVETVSHRRR